jgi:hypothetical protein
MQTSHKSMLKSFDLSLRSLAKFARFRPRTEKERDGFMAIYSASDRAQLKGRRLFQTMPGKIRLGPEAMREGDIIVTTENSLVPLVLREQENFHRFVGIAVLLHGEWFAARDKALEDKKKIKDIEIR